MSEEERELLENRGEEIENSEGRPARSPISYLLSPPSYEHEALRYAISELVPRHFDEVRRRKEELVTKTLMAVQERLTKEIIYWDQGAVELQLQEEAGKTPRLNSAQARQRRDELEARLRRRTKELAQERRVSPLPNVLFKRRGWGNCSHVSWERGRLARSGLDAGGSPALPGWHVTPSLNRYGMGIVVGILWVGEGRVLVPPVRTTTPPPAAPHIEPHGCAVSARPAAPCRAWVRWCS